MHQDWEWIQFTIGMVFCVVVSKHSNPGLEFKENLQEIGDEGIFHSTSPIPTKDSFSRNLYASM